MMNTENTTPPGTNGKHEFTMQYAGRELACWVEKEGNKLTVNMDNNFSAELEIQQDGSLIQTSGTELPDSGIEFIKKHVLGQDK